MRKLTTEEFARISNDIHNFKFDYSVSKYTVSKEKIEIICPKHGSFFQRAGAHIQGQGCPKCAIEDMVMDTQDFIERSVNIHGNKYDYSLVNYNHSATKVKIICKKHGIFYQCPSNHLRGWGCEKCRIEYGKYRKNNIPRYDIFHDDFSSIGIECKRDDMDENILNVRCYNCGKWYTPKYADANAKQRVINGKAMGENNLYCSDGCKNSCPVYRHRPDYVDPRSKLYVEKTEAQDVRNCQTDHLKQIQCDTHGYNYCEKCGDIIDVELHHTQEISKFGTNAINSSGHILLCAGCHVELHERCV